MKLKSSLTSLLLASLAYYPAMAAVEVAENQQAITIYEDVVFFDGYRALENLSDEARAMFDENDGILRHLTSLYSVKLTDDQLDRIGDHLTMHVEIGALCDNYDRIGNINLAFVPKGQESYKPEDVDRIEIGRFITPFMNKNYLPDHVPYQYDMDFMSLILRDSKLRSEYDIWVEFELFGIPYAANEQVKGCKDRQDVFAGTLTFVTDAEAAGLTDNNVLVPIVIKRSEDKGGNFNNYKEDCTDELGKTIKTWNFDLQEDVTDGQVVLITSNHGANSGGEEYNRRQHYVYFDDKLVSIYTPGRDSCEPFRQYNTQPNGIYGYNAMSDKQWQSFSNWCPGDKIDNRIFNLGAVAKGEHRVKIRVPKAQFANKQGDIPVSMFFQGVREGSLPAESGVDTVVADFRSSISVIGDKCLISSETPAREVMVYNIDGDVMDYSFNSNEVSLANCRAGVFVVMIQYADGLCEYHKIIRK